MNTRHYKTIESRSATALHLKVASKIATGWVKDGPVLEVTDYSHRRPVTRFSQAMTKVTWTTLNWGFA